MGYTGYRFCIVVNVKHVVFDYNTLIKNQKVNGDITSISKNFLAESTLEVFEGEAVAA